MFYMYSTLKSIVSVKPEISATSVCGRYLLYPDKKDDKRKVEDGLRLTNQFKTNKVKEQPLVSIITVCFNSENTIRQCIRSVLRQTYSNIEYIIIDGLSSDNTQEIILEYISAIDYFISEPDNGLYQAMNKGLSLAMGEYILFLNSDDWYIDECVEYLVRMNRNNIHSYVSSRAFLIDKHNSIAGKSSVLSINESIRLCMTLRHETMLIPSDIYNHIGGYDEDYSIISDWEFSLRLFKSGYKHKLFFFPVLNFRLNGVSMNNQILLEKERKVLLKKIFSYVNDEELNVLSQSPLKINYCEYKTFKQYKDMSIIRSINCFLAQKSVIAIMRYKSIELMIIKIKLLGKILSSFFESGVIKVCSMTGVKI